MARIAVDAKFFSDPRFKLLVSELGENRFTTSGRILELWHYCYEHKVCVVEPRMINAACEHTGMANALVSADLAYWVDDKICIKGVSKRIEYLLKASEDGKKSAAKRVEKFGTAQPKGRWSKGSPKVPSDDLQRSSEPIPIPIPNRNKVIEYNNSLPESAPKLKLIKKADEIFLPIARCWLDFAFSEMPWKVDDPKWNLESFALELETVSRKMNLTLEGLQKILEFISRDDFWRKNAVSPFGLLKKSKNNDLRKVDNIIIRMRTKKNREFEAMDIAAKLIEDNPSDNVARF